MDPRLLGSSQFHQALADYFYLVDKEYPKKGSLKLVGDRYCLSAEMRTILYRGVASSGKSNKRAARLVTDPEAPLIIDGYNVLFTLMNYRLGKFVFIGTDTFCRDAGLAFGNIRHEKVFRDCMEQLVCRIQLYRSLPLLIYLDDPVSESQNHYEFLLSLLYDCPRVDVKLVHSADVSILQHKNGTIATSDSELIDASTLPIIDLPRQILQEKFGAELFNLKHQLASSITS